MGFVIPESAHFCARKLASVPGNLFKNKWLSKKAKAIFIGTGIGMETEVTRDRKPKLILALTIGRQDERDS